MKMNLLDSATILYNLYKYKKDINEIDPDRSFNCYYKAFNHSIHVDNDIMNSILFYLDELQDKDAFYSPEGLTFEQFKAKMQRRMSNV